MTGVFTVFLRRHFPVAIIASIIFSVVIVSGGLGLLLKNHFDSADAVQRAQIVAGCERLNVKQAQDNRNQYADYVFDKIFVAFIVRPMSSRQTPQQKRDPKLFLMPLIAAERAKAWVPLVPDCTSVGVHYLPPPAIPFYQQLPPKSALAYP